MSIRESEKAVRYIGLLNAARCNGNWAEVPELCRKTEKHAPHRTALALSARSDAQVALYSTTKSTATGASSALSLTNLIPSLLSVLDQQQHVPTDVFEARVSLAAVHFSLEEYGLATSRLPGDITVEVQKLGEPEGWTQVCLVKAAYIRGSAQEKLKNTEEAVATYRSVLPYLSSLQSLKSGSPQFRLYTELLLSRLCSLSSDSVSKSEKDTGFALWAFRLWGSLWDSSSLPSAGYHDRRGVWKAYYELLSDRLQTGLSFSAAGEGSIVPLSESTERMSPEQRLVQKLQQRAELKRVEAVYETLFLKETQFPKASQSNQEVNAWVESVVANWRVLCGPTWHDDELGEGGKTAVGKEVLDILYRAATKSYHSPLILRYLFAVHASLAEFNLALKAYNSYIEIITRVKARVEKSGEPELDLDDNDTVILVSVEAIRILCRYGAFREAEKARDLGITVQKWVERRTPDTAPSTAVNGDEDEEERPTTGSSQISPLGLATAYRAIGISQAHWSHHTYDAAVRALLQSQAIDSLRKSLEPSFGDSHNVESLYALGLVLAESRDMIGAIQVVKQGLASRQPSSEPQESEFMEERRLMPLWHLLALLLTARDEYGTASRACEAAFEQFLDPVNLFGTPDNATSYRSEHLNESNNEKAALKTSRGLVDTMEFSEKECIVELKMTQLALLETEEGAAVAVDDTDELLGLYARLFGDSNVGRTRVQTARTVGPPPKSGTGTMRSVGGSVLSRSSKSKEQTSRPSTIATQATAAPTIQVFDEDGSPSQKHGHHHLHLLGHKKHHDGSEQKGHSNLKKKSIGSLRKKTSTAVSGASVDAAVVANEEARGAPAPNRNVDAPQANGQPLRSVAHNMPYREQPAPSGHASQPPKQDTRLPAPFPSFSYRSEPRFPTIYERRQKLSLLVKIWLFVGDLFLKAGAYEDAREAVEEAYKVVEGLEFEVATDFSSARAFAERRWGGGKSLDELWADVWSARGNLHLAKDLRHDAIASYEQALSHHPDHAQATVGLANLLIDIYTQALPAEYPEPALAVAVSKPTLSALTISDSVHSSQSSLPPAFKDKVIKGDESPEELTRLAARDRAYGLLSSLTKLGTSWDNAEAWYALARAYEEGGQIEKAKEVLWWCVELENGRPLRHWSNLGFGGFVL